MPRSRAQSVIPFATFGSVSHTWTPGTAVGIGLNALVPFSGLGSKVSMWLAPPVMNSRMQCLCLAAGRSAARAASVLSQPDVGTPKAPAAVSFSQSRGQRRSENMINLASGGDASRKRLVVEQELAAVEQRPEQFAERLRLVRRAGEVAPRPGGFG